jgi:hypothetical protein
MVRGLAIGSVLLSMAGCTTTSLMLSAAGMVTETSIPVQIAKHLHDKMTEGDPVPCHRMDSVERGLTERCGRFEPGSIAAQDLPRTALQDCPLAVAARVAVREPSRWQALPELLDKGATPRACPTPPLVALAQADPCPDFSQLDASALAAVKRLALEDPRSVHHDAMRMLSCPHARRAGLEPVLHTWLAQGRLPATGLNFSPLAALHPEHLYSELALSLEAQGHSPVAAQGAYVGSLPHGFDQALREGHWAALDWWIARVPGLVNQVPSRQSNQVAWVPLAQVLVPSFMPDAEQRERTAEFLLSRGADPWRRLPGQPQHTVVSYARLLRSPLVAVLERPARDATPVTTAVAQVRTPRLDPLVDNPAP